MAKSHPKYAPEFRRQMVELHRAGRSFTELAREFGCTSWSIRQWVKHADWDAGRGDGGLSTAERQELAERGRFCQEPRPGLQTRAPRAREAFFEFVKANQAILPYGLYAVCSRCPRAASTFGTLACGRHGRRRISV